MNCKCGCGREIIIQKHHKWISEYIHGHNRKGKIVSEETKQKMSESHKGKKVSEETKQKQSELKKREKNPNFGKHFSEEHKQKLSEANKREKHHNWKGGISEHPYCERWTEKLREQIRKRDRRICQNCDKTEMENNKKLSVHHVHYDKENCYPDLITLCCSCNSIVNGNRLYWEYVFMEKLTKRNLINYFGDIK